MLTHIHIRDFVIVDELELDFRAGMTVLTGETGAGKSILIDALGLALGDRADTGVIRHGCDRAEVAVLFDLGALPALQQTLEEMDLAAGGECQLRRVILREGRSRAYINGSPVPVQQLRAIGDRLVDIHGQHEHQSLMQRDTQRRLLDSYAGHTDAISRLAAAYRQWRERRQALDELQDAARQRDDRLDLLRFHLDELERLAPAPGEWEAIEAEHRRLAHAGELIERCNQTLGWLYDDELSADGLLSQGVDALERFETVDDRLKGVLELLGTAQVQTREAADELRRFLDRLELDPERLQYLESRIAALQQLARKHRIEPAALPQLLEDTRTELARLEQADQNRDAMAQEITALEQAWREQALGVRRQRRKAAADLGRAITEGMQELGMPGGRFEVQVEALEDEQPTRHGLDRIEFRVSANPGQPPQALARVASGGELSRISLAIQVVAKDAATTPTLVFDEVDSGIGGAIAEVVGRQLRGLGERSQVLCVTHLPQVAAQAHQHYQVHKLTGDDSTRTRIRALSDTERSDEIARMLGGMEITDSTRRHAEEMIARAQQGEAKKKKGKKKTAQRK
ncbi:DNA repair protein RecN [Thiohalobacter sp. COW1]|uniref:DNA repair protein RecN n=1 Tax=Thiohalobacter sp. COW1 TaxID=2795687 RepID=UPI001915F0C0|nr:DNA repair protein RecN [Thiohalobacter sp. COW1]BCO30868.1 DNA repair protein RecN [Thiohalobacter sp. COW1]